MLPRKPLVFRLAFLLSLLVLSASAARADEVVITSGSLVGSRSPLPWTHVVNIQGVNFSFSGMLTNAPGECNPCQPGDIVSVNLHSAAHSNSSGSDLSGSYAQPPDQIASSLNFFGGTFAIPDEDAPVVVMPFTFTGFVSFSHGGANPTFQHDLLGQGFVTFTFSSFFTPGVGRTMTLQSAVYTFQDPAAVPEPATLLLFGTGLAAALGVRRRRKARPGV